MPKKDSQITEVIVKDFRQILRITNNGIQENY